MVIWFPRFAWEPASRRFAARATHSEHMISSMIRFARRLSQLLSRARLLVSRTCCYSEMKSIPRVPANIGAGIIRTNVPYIGWSSHW